MGSQGKFGRGRFGAHGSMRRQRCDLGPERIKIGHTLYSKYDTCNSLRKRINTWPLLSSSGASPGLAVVDVNMICECRYLHLYATDYEVELATGGLTSSVGRSCVRSPADVAVTFP